MAIFSGIEFTPTCRPAGVSFQPLNSVLSFALTTLSGPVGMGRGLACPSTEEVSSKKVAAIVASRFIGDLLRCRHLYRKSRERLMKFFTCAGNISAMNKEQLPFLFGAQYYRAPTPERDCWAMDLA